MCLFLPALLTGCGLMPSTRYETVPVTRWAPVPSVLTEPLPVPRPNRDMTFGECVSDYAPLLLQVIGQANRDRETLRELNDSLIAE